MQPAEAAAFAKAMDRLFSIYGAQITTAMREAWWGSLEQFSLGDVMQAMTMHASDADGGRFVPTPAHIIRKLDEVSAMRRKLAAEIRAGFEREIRKIEDDLYRARHDHQLERIDTSAMTVIVSECHRKLREVNGTMRQQLRKEGHYVDADQNHKTRAIGA